jgi:hypothetical protein
VSGAKMNKTRKYLQGILILSVLCFILPFVSVSCNRQKVVTFTGFQLALGTTVQQPQVFGSSKAQKVDPEPMAVLALVCCLAAVVLGFLSSRAVQISAAVLAGVSVVALMLLKSNLESKVQQQSLGAFQIDFEIGFWFVVLLNVSGAALAAFTPWRSRERSPAAERAP